ncbi:hypothetical protein KC878_04250 [Candidatus Saccharibacteria bacterium]|nr:hypothetical protein [Candidatus Saccharibacteria bacterium]MCB9821469.1 hypothetical protein [Candidatus Nomurabacteria bacterium]
MFRKKKTNTDQLHMAFHVGDTMAYEYIPAEVSATYIDFLRYVRWILTKLHKPHYYYWQYRHLYDIQTRKQEDLRFIMHVWQDHQGKPTNRMEKWHYYKAMRLYGSEVEAFVLPKLRCEGKGQAITHEYALAYYKRWLYKDADPELKCFYHGVEIDEIVELIDRMIARTKQSKKRRASRRLYLNKQLAKKQSGKP